MTMLVVRSASSPCSRWSAAGSSSRRSGTRSRTGSSRSPSRSREASKTGRKRSSTSSPSRLGLAGIGVAWAIYGTRQLPVPRLAGAPARCSSTSSTSTRLYDRLFYRPPRRTRSSCSALIEGSAGRRRASAGVAVRPRADAGSAALQTGLLRDLCPRPRHGDWPSSSSSSWRCVSDRWLTTILIFLPSRARSSAGSCRCGDSAGAFATLVALVEVGFWILAARALRLTPSRAAPSSSSGGTGSRLGVSYHVGVVTVRALARRAWRSSSWLRPSRTPSGSAASGRARTSG